MTRRRKAVLPPPVIPYACPECDHRLSTSATGASCPAKTGGCGWRWWTHVPTPAMAWDATPRSSSAAALVKAAGPLWSVRVTAGQGGERELDPERPYASDGSRPNVYRTVPCLSEAVRLAGPGGWRAVATWLSLDDGASWKPGTCLAWYAGEHGRPITWPTPVPQLDLRALIALPWAPPPAAATSDTDTSATNPTMEATAA